MEIDNSSPAPAFLTKAAMYLLILLKYRDRQWAKGVRQGIGMSATRYAATLSQKEALTDRFTAFFDRFDVWLTPVASFGAFEHQRAGRPFRINGRRVPYTDAMARFNLGCSQKTESIAR